MGTPLLSSLATRRAFSSARSTGGWGPPKAAAAWAMWGGVSPRGLGPSEGVGGLGHVAVVALEGIDRLPQPEQGLEGVANLAEGRLDAEELVELLKEVGELRLGQTQALVSGDQLKALALSLGVGG